MRELIRRIFDYHKFKLIELNFGDLFISNDEKKYFWLSVEQDDISKVLELQNDWFDQCRGIINSKEFDKNTSLLIISNKEENETKKQEVLLIEEDPFQFKKYVLLFEENILNQLLSKTEDGNVEKILDLIVNDIVFNEYKANYSEYNWRHLLYHLAHKLPFLKINVDVNQDLDNLFSDANESLLKESLLDYSEFIEKQNQTEIYNEIDSLDIDELISFLDDSIENGNSN